MHLRLFGFIRPRQLLACAMLVGVWLPTALPATRAEAADALTLLPGAFTLNGPEARQQLVLEEARAGQFVNQLREGMTFTSSDPKIVAVEADVAVPRANGKAVVTATAGDRKAAVEVTVVGMDKPFEWSFRNQVEPVLAKTGCNGGACHGALAGKRGFKLSLSGFDPDNDYSYLTRQARGRRIVLSDPGRSLLLLKPTGVIPHKGGVRFDVDSREYRILSEWIAAGVPAPHENDARLDKLELLPVASVLKVGAKQQLLVIAHFSDGHSEDVSHWAKYTSTNDSVATVDQSGLVQVAGNGEAAIRAWYQSWNVIASVTSPYETKVAQEVYTRAESRNFIDQMVLAKLRNLNLPPSPQASDVEFVRRVFIDTIGVLPTAAETGAFLADPSPDKRDKLIESLLARPEFVDYWSYKWSDLLLVNSEKLRPQAMWAYYHWIRNNVAANTPWDKFARSLVTATGSTLENGAANFFVLHQDPQDLAETVSVAFLGTSINCAKCHNHPLEKWTNDQYYSMANLFSRVRSKDLPGDGNRVVFAVEEGELLQPRTGRARPPQPLDGKALSFDTPGDRRVAVADWLTSPDNPYFTRAITNRVWANFMGVGLVEHVDDLRLTNPASNAELFAAAAKFLVDNQYDVKALMRAILQSKTYQRTSKSLPENAADQRFYSHYYPRRLMAEVLLDAMSQVTGSPTEFKNYAPGWRALQLPDVNVNSYFLRTFGRPARTTTCECERTAEPSMVQVLNISNGTAINEKLEAKGNRIEKYLVDKTPDDQIIVQAYLAALSRQPTDEEKARVLKMFAESAEPNKRVLLEDFYWGILSSKEFLFNH